MTKFNLDEHIVNLLRDEPFFAALSRRMEKVPTTAVPTAGVKFNAERCRFEMYYNPTFMNELHESNPVFVKGVLLHEFYHIVLLHVTTRIPGDRMTKKWNVATDLAINSELSVFEKDFESPSGYVVQSSILPLDKALIPSVGPFAKYPPHLSAEEYMELLPKEEDEEDSEDEEEMMDLPGSDDDEEDEEEEDDEEEEEIEDLNLENESEDEEDDEAMEQDIERQMKEAMLQQLIDSGLCTEKSEPPKKKSKKR